MVVGCRWTTGPTVLLCVPIMAGQRGGIILADLCVAGDARSAYLMICEPKMSGGQKKYSDGLPPYPQMTLITIGDAMTYCTRTPNYLPPRKFGFARWVRQQGRWVWKICLGKN